MNLGLISMLNHDYSKANEQFGAAAGVPETADAMGVYYLAQGDLQKAIRTFGDQKTNNAALAQILNKNYTEARDILGAIKVPDATTYYLSAVLGARTNNQNLRSPTTTSPLSDTGKNLHGCLIVQHSATAY